MKKKYKKSTRPEKSTKKVQNFEVVKKKVQYFQKGTMWQHCTYLGIKLDCKMNFEAHALECLRLISHKLYICYPKLETLLQMRNHLQFLKARSYPILITEISFTCPPTKELWINYKKYRIEL